MLSHRAAGCLGMLSVFGLPALSEPSSAREMVQSSAAFDHLAIYVRDVDRSATFYKTVFGLTQVPAPFPVVRWLTLSNGTMLHIVPGRPTPVTNAKWDHFALACGDMAAMIAKLNAGGIKWADIEGRHAPQVRADGVQQIFIQDPDGYWIEINDAHKQR